MSLSIYILSGLKSIVLGYGTEESRLVWPNTINLAQMPGNQITFNTKARRIAKKKQLITMKGAHIKSKHYARPYDECGPNDLQLAETWALPIFHPYSTQLPQPSPSCQAVNWRHSPLGRHQQLRFSG